MLGLYSCPEETAVLAGFLIELKIKYKECYGILKWACHHIFPQTTCYVVLGPVYLPSHSDAVTTLKIFFFLLISKIINTVLLL